MRTRDSGLWRRLFCGAILCSILLLSVSCGKGTPVITAINAGFRAPAFDETFRRIWDDGAAEVSLYETVRLRDGQFHKGVATVIVRRAIYSEDDRVAVENGKQSADADLFPAMQLTWIERFADDMENRQEMTTAAVSLSSVDGRVTGSLSKASFSSQSWNGQLFHELLFDATGVRSHQYSYFGSEGDEQITLPYPRDGISNDAIWLIARHMAAPALKPGEQRSLMLLPSLREARMQHRPLRWSKATLARTVDKPVGDNPTGLLRVRGQEGFAELFRVGEQPPYQVLHWEDSLGQRAEWISGSRIKLSPAPAGFVSRKIP